MSTKAMSIGGMLVIAGLLGPEASAQTPTTLYSFAGGSDAMSPVGELVLHEGILFGASGGTGSAPYTSGTIYQVDATTGQEAVLHTFKKGPSGYQPDTGLTLVNGNLFGATMYGGTNRSGIVFKQAVHNGHYKKLDNLSQSSGLFDCFLLQGGTLFGTALGGGSPDNGIVFQLDPVSGVESVLYHFQGPDGAEPLGAIASVDGILYGTTVSGGANGQGVVFSFNPASQSESVLYNFPTSKSNGDPVLPVWGLISANGNLYGTTDGYGTTPGTAFQIDLSTGIYTLLTTFPHPQGTYNNEVHRMLYKDGKLYGTTSSDGASTQGTIYSIDIKTHLKQVLYNFTGGSDGGSPAAGLTDGGHVFYGVTTYGGSAGNGVVFAFTP